MPKIKNPLRRWLDRVQNRFARSRPGSVLVLVVALLVLMALIGTAYITTARTDRFSAQQNAFNTQIDLLVQGVVNMAQSMLTDTSFQQAGGTVRPDPTWQSVLQSVTPPPPPSLSFWNKHWDDPTTNPWMGSRIPQTMREAVGDWAATRIYNQGEWVWYLSNYYVCRKDNTGFTANSPTPDADPADWLLDPTARDLTPCWFAISAPLSTGAQFEDLRYPMSAGSIPPFAGARSRFLVRPTAMRMGGKLFPALEFYYPGGGGQTDSIRAIPAASASGDGIADSLLWRLPIGEINGITYYAAVRMIDDNSAVNLNTAYAATYDFNGQGSASPIDSLGIFPGNIGLAEMLKTFTDGNDTGLGWEMSAVNAYRFKGQPRPSGVWVASANGPFGSPVDDNSTVIPGFAYRTVFDAMFMGLGRKLNNPSPQFQPFSWGDSAAFAYRYDMVNTSSTPTAAEACFPTSAWAYASKLPWSPADVGDTIDQKKWFYPFYETKPLLNPTDPKDIANRRPYLVARSPLSNQLPAHQFPQLSNLLPPYDASGTSPRASLNTAPFPELWRAYFNVVADAPAPTTVPIPGYPKDGAPQFRSSLRDPDGTGNAAKIFFPFDQMQLLRSALAAINTVDLRDSDENVTSAHVTLRVIKDGTPHAADVIVYGNERQPFITEVYVNNDTAQQPPEIVTDAAGTKVANPHAGKSNPKGYVAIELYNPYPVDIYLTNYQIGVINRQLANGTPPGTYPTPLKILPLTKFLNGFGRSGNTPYVPARGYLVLENYSETPPADDQDTAATYRPLSAFNTTNPMFKMPPDSETVFHRPPPNFPVPGAPSRPGAGGAKFFYVPTLHEVVHDQGDTTKPGGEVYLLRTRYPNGPTVIKGDYDEGQLEDRVPVDSIDLAGVWLPETALGPFNAWHYVRSNGQKDGSEWKFVYPGRWTPNGGIRQEGLIQALPTGWAYDKSVPDMQDPWIVTAPPQPINLGAPDLTASYVNNFAPIQLNNVDFGGPNKLTQGPFAMFPFGGFARTGDVLQVPFIGAYRVMMQDNDNDRIFKFIEMNTITADSALADAQLANTADQKFEQVGRFCPLLASNSAFSRYTVAGSVNLPSYDPYGWAARIFDYFTAIQAPQDDYLPNVSPTIYGQWDPNPYFINDNTSLTWTNIYGNASPADLRYARPVKNIAKVPAQGPNFGTENNVPIEGLININTASWRVLASVPFYPTDRMKNMQIAQAIVAYRQQNGPFKTLFDLNQVSGFQSIYLDPATNEYDIKAGDISPNFHNNPGNEDFDWVMDDFEQRFAAINRVSNLLTTRSDTYTTYILVQGWRGIGTNNLELVVQRRAAFIADRSAITATNKGLNIINVQTN
ncbi:MAG: Helix-hairpin-helix motif containing protein [Phycisphaerales bacterium]|nr:Helix-hairpin-helix motif containing protein [Phycisphaerales bacterium]